MEAPAPNTYFGTSEDPVLLPAVKERLLAELRSGNWRQAQSCLRDADGGYCCLGVLCDIIDPRAWESYEGGDDENEEWEHAGDKEVPTFNVLDNCLTQWSREQFDRNFLLPFPRKSTLWEHEIYAASLTDCNDSGFTFPQIADLIQSFY